MPITYQHIQKALRSATFVGKAEGIGEATILSQPTTFVVADGVAEQEGAADFALVVPTQSFDGNAEGVGKATIVSQPTTSVVADAVAEQEGAAALALVVPTEVFLGNAEGVGKAVIDRAPRPPIHINDGYIESTRNSSSDYDLTAWFDYFDYHKALLRPKGYVTKSGASGPNEVLTTADDTETSQGNSQYRFNFSWNQAIIESGGETYIFWLTGVEDVEALTEDFEGSSAWGQWSNTSAYSVSTTSSYTGSTAGLLDSGGAEISASMPYRDVPLKHYDTFEFYYWEQSAGSYGGGIRLMDSAGTPILGFATDNPEWIVYDADGNTQVHDPAAYEQWVRVRFYVDWGAGTFEYEIEGFSHLETGSGTLAGNGNGIDRIQIERYAGGWSPASSKIYLRLDDIDLVDHYEGFEKNGWERWLGDAGGFAMTDSAVVYSGDLSGHIDTGINTVTSLPQRDIPLRQYDVFEWYFRETSDQKGAGIELKDSAGTVICGVATDNPEWVVEDADGNTQVYDPAAYEQWVHVRLEFDWANSTFTYEITGFGHTETGSGLPMGGNGNGIGLVDVNRYHSGDGGWEPVSGTKVDFWLDDISWMERSLEERVVDCETITVTHPTTDGNTNSTTETYDDTQETSC